jgi:hypothetical protein
VFTKVQFLLLATVFGIGFAAGLYFNLLLPTKSGVVDVPSIILAIFGGAGLVVTLTRWVIDWYNQPTLEIVGVIELAHLVPYGRMWDNYVLSSYFLRIINTKRKGMADTCKANLVIPNTPIGNVPAYWRHTNQSTSVDISTLQDLRLFTLTIGHNKIFFPLGSPRKEDLTPEGENEQPYDKFLQKELEVWFGSKTGRFIQNPYRKKIEDIIKEAKKEH